MKKTLLIILDGWGIGNKGRGDLIYNANTPNMKSLINTYPHTKLISCGEQVGLPDGHAGNSEVGHLHIGAGRIVYQDLVRINKSIKNNMLAENPVLTEAMIYARDNHKAVHFIGLTSDGGVHSMSSHLNKLCDTTKTYKLDKVYIHCITDGRDTDPESGYRIVSNLLKHLKKSNGRIASLTGRYYTMDRDKRWERIKEGYDLMVHGSGYPSRDILHSIKMSYENGITDEFIKPVVMINEDGSPVGLIKEDDVVICFNFRADRLRQITKVLTLTDIPEYGMNKIPLHFITMTTYDESFQGVKVLFEKQNLSYTMGEVISRQNCSQLRIAETEKYAHVTFFFNGGREEEFRNERRILISSPNVSAYNLMPEMSAFEVKNAVITELNRNSADFICLNFANCDIVGHTGVAEAIIRAVEAVDHCVGDVTVAALKNDYSVMIVGDHGNAENAINADGSPNKAHSMNPVPCILIGHDHKPLKEGILADVAPTLLSVMGLGIPGEMTGRVLY